MQRQVTIKHFTYYFRRMMKFYDLKVQGVPQALFVLLLAVLFGSGILINPLIGELNINYQQFLAIYNDFSSTPENIDAFMTFFLSEEYAQMVETMLKIFGIIVIRYSLSMLLSFFYLGAYLVDLEANEASVAVYMRKFLTALPRFIGFQVLFFIGLGILGVFFLFFISLLAVILPLMYFVIVLLPFAWLVIEAIFIFKEITLLDTGVGIFKNFALSWKLSAGNRFMIGRNIFFIVLLSMFVRMFVVGSNVLLSLFITSFIEVIVLLIKQRLIALMYISRTRVARDNKV
ncbi:MAG: hypothetical protein QM315_03755 [Bacillota bacterium]|nr:hypothetical protein [Bacillota bacterium]